ncbi:MAG: STAS domain-containing protein [Steroidobacteraceae bacterium]|nr:STAS domain-containing protein [Steroidobacteraceae bacterium]
MPRKKPARRVRSAVALPPVCGLEQAPALQAGLLRALASKGSVTLDASAVERVDTAGVQLLVAFWRDRRATGRGVAWYGAGPVLQAAFDALGLAETVALAAGGDAP